ncbi:hypothetical protein L1049_022686 [Liquidambar formosana]|uniref:Helicase-like transcription factor CHR28 n=1 Tax=Liquidambar formosana TaxID=63359 RepID=A0AAP0WP25_LIQFO
MPNHADPLHDYIESAQRCCSLLSGWIGSFISRHCTDLIGLPFRNSKVVAGRGNHLFTSISSMEPIDITSSDSDLEIEDGREIDTSPIRRSTPSANPRILPPWASTPGSNSTSRAYGGQSQKVPSPKRASASNGSSGNINPHSLAKLQMHPNTGEDIRASNWHIAQANDSSYSTENGKVGQPQIFNSQNSDIYGMDYGKYSSQQALKRTLPSSLQPHVANTKLNNLVENVGSSQIRDSGKSYPSAGSSLNNGKNYMKNHFGSGNDDEVIMYEKNGSRILPPSLMHGKSILMTQYASSSGPVYHSGLGEERDAGNDERLIYQAALQDLNQPKVEAKLPDGLLSVPLLRHQKIALAWMLQKETRSLPCLGGILADDQGLGKTISMIALIQMQRSLLSKSKSEDLCNSTTEALNLDDDDDNGNAGLDKVKQSGESDDFKPIPEVSISMPAFSKRRPDAGTLVVCPASILRQWDRELDEKVADEAKLSVLIYHGGGRTKDPVELAKYDVVLTTYSIVTNEVPKQPAVDEEDGDEKNGEKYGLSSDFSSNKKRKKASNVNKRRKKGRTGIDGSSNDYDCGPLARVRWSRVILDEAQTIKNHRTQVARACCSLRAKRRWCLSGTPIQNAIDDLYSYFRFLKYDPYTAYKSFCDTIKNPISRNSIHGYKKLQAVLRAIMLRRTKGTIIDGEPIINLPPKTVCLTKVDFSTEERAFYSKLEADSRSQFKAYAAAGTVNQNYANILLMLLRLRQACDHPLLVKGFNSDSVGKVSLEMAKRLPPDMLINLLNLLETSLAICPVCSDPPEDAVVTMCGHVFCYQCVSEYLTGDDNTCPAPGCKEQLGADVVFSKATLRSSMSDDLDSSPSNSSHFTENSIVLQNEYSSAKIRAALEILQTHCMVKNPSSEVNGLMSCNGNSSSSGKTYSENCYSGVSASKYTTVYSDSQTEGPTKANRFLPVD